MRLEPGAALPLLASHMGWPGLPQDTAPCSFLLLLRSPHDPPAWDNVGTCALHPRAGRCTLVQHRHVQSRALNGLSAGTLAVNQVGCPVPSTHPLLLAPTRSTSISLQKHQSLGWRESKAQLAWPQLAASTALRGSGRHRVGQWCCWVPNTAFSIP